MGARVVAVSAPYRIGKDDPRYTICPELPWRLSARNDDPDDGMEWNTVRLFSTWDAAVDFLRHYWRALHG